MDLNRFPGITPAVLEKLAACDITTVAELIEAVEGGSKQRALKRSAGSEMGAVRKLYARAKALG